MVQHRTMLKVADNTGAKKLQVIRVLGGYKKRYARLGDIVTVVVKEATPHTMVKKSEVLHAVIGMFLATSIYSSMETMSVLRRVNMREF